MSAPQRTFCRSRQVRRYLVPTVLVTGLLAGAYLAKRAWDQSSERSKALTLAEKGTPAAALPALLHSLENSPNDPDLLRAIVQTQIKAGVPIADVEPFTERLWRVRPDDPLTFWLRLVVLRQLGRLDDAAAAGERALQLDPNENATRAALAGIYLDLGRYPDAAREFRQLLRSSRDDASVDYSLGLARAEWEQGNQTDALQFTESILQRNPGHAGALTLQGLIYFRAAEYARALVAFDRLTSADANQEIVLYHRAQTLDRLGRAEDARALYLRLAAVQDARRFTSDAGQRPDDMGLQVRAAEAWLKAGEPDTARKALIDALARLGPHRAALLALAEAHRAAGQPELANKARADAERVP